MNAQVSGPADPITRKRRLVADLCRILGAGTDSQRAIPGPAGSGNGDTSNAVSLSPRMRQTLERLLAGDSEKEIAVRLRLSPHTVHVYVKTLYRRFDVCSRGELFARFIERRRD
jgi:DNA-binding CsgD family transcriptional regulator